MRALTRANKDKMSSVGGTEDLRLPVAKGSTRDVPGKMAQFKMANVSNFKASFRIENGL